MLHTYLVKTHLKVKIRKLFQKEFSPHCVSFKNNNSIGYIEPGKIQTQKMYIVQSHATISALDYKVVGTKYSINITFLYQ